MSTDPSSSDFDPLLALYSGVDEAPTDDVKVFDNIAMFEGNLRKQELAKTETSGPSKRSQNKSFSKRKKVEEEAKNRDVGKLLEFMEMRKKIDRGENPVEEEPERKDRSQKVRTRRTILTSMEKLSEGPYNILHRIVNEHLRCNVYVRDFCGLRGVCSGYVVAFDRYTNLAMVDVDETFRKAPVGKVADHQKSLSVSSLEDAVKTLSLGKTNVKVVENQRKNRKHRATTGVQILPKTEPTQSTKSSSSGKVEVVGPQFFGAKVFHGGTPQLYHRHLNNLLVRGDSIVLVAVK